MTFILSFTAVCALGIALQEHLAYRIPIMRRTRAMKYRRKHSGFRQFKHY